jgi:hypothetical protein
MWEVMTACEIMHNMIVKDEHDEGILDQGWEFQGELVAPHPGELHLRSSSMCTRIFMIMLLTISCRRL